MQTNNPVVARAVIDRISARPRLAPEKMPVLNAILEQIATSGTEFLRKLCAPPMVFVAGALALARSDEQLERDADCIAALYVVPEWDSSVLIGVDRPFVNVVMEAAFGGDGSEIATDTSRPFSGLDIRVAKAMLEHMASALTDAFQPISKITLVHERTETRLNAQTLGPRSHDIVVARLSIKPFGEEGNIFMYFPASSLAQFRSQFERATATNTTTDPAWTRQLEIELGQTFVQLQAVIGTVKMSLDDISRLRVGQLIDLGVTPGALISLEGPQERLFTCRLAQSNRMFVATVEDRVATNQDLMAGTVPGFDMGSE